MKKKDDRPEITVTKKTVENINKINRSYKELCAGYGLNNNEVSFALCHLVSSFIVSVQCLNKEKEEAVKIMCLEILTHVMEVIGESENGN